MRYLKVSLAVALMLGLCLILTAPASGTALTAGQMYLNPASVPSAQYIYTAQSVGYTMSFSDVSGLQVLPPLMATSDDYYFEPCVDYVGDITTDGSGSITFDRAGPYHVLATYDTNGSTGWFAVGIDFRINQPVTGPTRTWHDMPTPDGGDVVIVDPDLPDPPSTYGGNPDIQDTFTTWDEVTAHLQTLTNAHVELHGHGAPSEFYFRGNLVLDSSSTDWLDSMKGHISYLSFISCSTGKGCELLSAAAERLGTSSGYTDVIGDTTSNGQWFINDDGYLKIVPEPLTMLGVFAGIAALAGYIRKRRLAQA